MTTLDQSATRGGTARRDAIRAIPPWAWLLIVLTAASMAVGVVIRVSLLGAGSLWLDELWTLDAVSRSLKEMAGARLVSDVNPPLWIILSWFWLRLAGTYDAATMRLLPLGFGILATAAPVVAAVRLRSLRPALLVMAALLALSLVAVQFAVELRSYSMLIALGTIATVIWAGLLVGDLPREGRWIFGFALAGALAGFSHYYGILLYFGEAVVLLLAWTSSRAWRSVRLLVAWGALSVAPIVAWLVLTRGYFPNTAVGFAPTIETIQTWLAHAFGPFSNVVAGHGPGYPYPAGPLGIETVLLILAVVVIAGIGAFRRIREHSWRMDSPAVAGGAALVALAIGIAVSWIESLVLPPSMSYRNLAALTPALLLAVGCAATAIGSQRTRWLTGSAVVAAWLLVAAGFTVRNGVASLAPAWQQQSGYRDGADTLLAARSASPRPTLIGLNTSWGWHGQWDAALRSALRSPPAESTDPPPLEIRWVADVTEARAGGRPAGRVVVFSDSFDPRLDPMLAWVEEGPGPCTETRLGGPAFGVVVVLDCP